MEENGQKERNIIGRRNGSEWIECTLKETKKQKGQRKLFSKNSLKSHHLSYLLFLIHFPSLYFSLLFFLLPSLLSVFFLLLSSIIFSLLPLLPFSLLLSSPLCVLLPSLPFTSLLSLFSSPIPSLQSSSFSALFSTSLFLFIYSSLLFSPLSPHFSFLNSFPFSSLLVTSLFPYISLLFPSLSFSLLFPQLSFFLLYPTLHSLPSLPNPPPSSHSYRTILSQLAF